MQSKSGPRSTVRGALYTFGSATPTTAQAGLLRVRLKGEKHSSAQCGDPIRPGLGRAVSASVIEVSDRGCYIIRRASS